MGYSIDYIVLCENGKIRGKNQDNFWCAGKFLESQNEGLTEPINDSSHISGRTMFAVFDGMGGEKCGEIAAYLAAKTFNSCVSQEINADAKEFLLTVCDKMNKEICSYAEENYTGHMGTTAAILVIEKKKIHICNLGDSKILRHSAGKLNQISVDHVFELNNDKKPFLTQHLGIHETEFVIEPFVDNGDYVDGDKYLICSDGLTDMVPLEEIEAVLSTQKSAFECGKILMDTALSNGGTDNITIILCSICKKKWFSNTFFRRAGAENVD